MVVIDGGRIEERTPCKCKSYGECRCARSSKPPKKTFTNRNAPMYKNEAGTAFSLSYIIAEVGRHFGHMFGAFTMGEIDGHLVIHTGMTRDEHMEKLMHKSCKAQPCEGSCEDGCKSLLSTREVAGL